MKVAVIGAGPHGLAAAWAAVNAGFGVDIFDRDPETSGRNHGVFYLESPMRLSLPYQVISTSYCPTRWTKTFASQAYAQKVYGTGNQSVSLKSETSRTVYDGQAALEQLNAMFRGQIIRREFDRREDLVKLLEGYSRVIVTVPAPVFIKDREKGWHSVKAWVRSEKVSNPSERGVVIYFAHTDVLWSRVSLIFDRLCIEAVDLGRADPREWREIRKVVTAPRSHFADWPPEILWCGRYGAWDKDVLVVDTYTRVYNHLLNVAP